ncbi:hypothetical protein JIG36_09245 [Actinoplanes sp. LDG1-06]|uniref:Uncharacterized protein n=1 Tax=Paractinoplanes ovalisporus TaxID=2810368 RepID=A0ABS2A7D0_9ACTN|nr:hypothetical protein [Actinoplanes ovalisporus]MBM2615738.1 hypothetical protein [Actinoplanes ovalisporus]
MDKVILIAALLTWWFWLRPDSEVVNAVDTVSYLFMIYSLWRAGRSFASKPRSLRSRVRRNQVDEAGDQGKGVSVESSFETTGDAGESETAGRRSTGHR